MVIVAVLPLQPPACIVQQFPYFPCNVVIASCLSKDHTRKYGVRSGLQGGCGLVIFFVVTYSYKGMHSNFLVFQYSCQEFTIVHMGKKFMYNTCLIPKDRSNDFSCWWHILWISSYLWLLCASSPSIAAWIQLYKWLTQVSFPVTFCNRKPSPLVLWWCKRSELLPSLCLCAQTFCHCQALH